MALSMIDRDKNRPSLARALVGYAVTGSMAAAAYVGTMAFVIERLDRSVTLAAVAAFGIGTVVSYTGNALLSFGTRPSLATVHRFLAVTLVGLGLNTAIAWGLDRLGFAYLLISLVVLVVVPAWNFAAHYFWTFAGTPAFAADRNYLPEKRA